MPYGAGAETQTASSPIGIHLGHRVRHLSWLRTRGATAIGLAALTVILLVATAPSIVLTGDEPAYITP